MFLTSRPRLRMIRGGRYRELVLGRTRVTVNERVAIQPDAFLFEEDVRSTAFGSAHRDLPPTGGTVVTTGEAPAEMRLVVDSDGVCRPGWLQSAWEAALKEADRLHFERVAAPLVGCIGGATVKDALLTFAGVVTEGRYANLRHVDLICGSVAGLVYGRLKSYAHPVRN